MDRELVNHKILNVILSINSIKEKDYIHFDTHLYKECGLNSINVIELIVAIEDEFSFEFDNTSLDLKNFETVNKITDLVIQKIIT